MKKPIEKQKNVEETSKRSLGKAQVDYWKSRLFRPGYTPKGGRRILVPTLKGPALCAGFGF